MDMTITQWAWHDCLGMDDWLPPEPRNKKKQRFGVDADCWLCGGHVTPESGWPLKDALAPTFTDFNQAKAPWSQTVCGACVALSRSDAYGYYARSRGMPEFFPEKEGKKPRALNWLYSSHIFGAGLHLQPDRKAWRDILLNPPEPPFAMIMAVNGKKHVIFKGAVSSSRDQFTVQADETRIFVDLDNIKALMTEFESAYNQGFSKDSLLTGQYNQAAIMSAGLSVWRGIEASMAKWRSSHPGLMQLCHFCAQKAVEKAI